MLIVSVSMSIIFIPLTGYLFFIFFHFTGYLNAWLHKGRPAESVLEYMFVHLCFPIGTKTLLSTENVILQNQELSCIKKPSAMLN